MSNMGLRTVQRHLSSLVEKGKIARRKRGVEDGGGLSDRYAIGHDPDKMKMYMEMEPKVANPPVPISIREFVYDRDGMICRYCKSDVSERPTLDHLTPVSRGGGGHVENLAVCCGPCNSSKRDKTESEYLIWLSSRRSHDE